MKHDATAELKWLRLRRAVFLWLPVTLVVFWVVAAVFAYLIGPLDRFGGSSRVWGMIALNLVFAVVLLFICQRLRKRERARLIQLRSRPDGTAGDA